MAVEEDMSQTVHVVSMDEVTIREGSRCDHEKEVRGAE